MRRHVHRDGAEEGEVGPIEPRHDEPVVSACQTLPAR
jgi:hypothetical protein